MRKNQNAAELVTHYLTQLALIYRGMATSEDVIALWVASLKDFPQNLIKEAFVYHLAHNKFEPKPADLREWLQAQTVSWEGESLDSLPKMREAKDFPGDKWQGACVPTKEYTQWLQAERARWYRATKADMKGQHTIWIKARNPYARYFNYDEPTNRIIYFEWSKSEQEK